MKIPLSWLKEYVDFEDTVEGLADKLTFSGVEVEGIERLGGGVPGVVVAPSVFFGGYYRHHGGWR